MIILTENTAKTACVDFVWFVDLSSVNEPFVFFLTVENSFFFDKICSVLSMKIRREN